MAAAAIAPSGGGGDARAVTFLAVLAGGGAVDQISAADSKALAVEAVGRSPPSCAIDGSISLIWRDHIATTTPAQKMTGV